MNAHKPRYSRGVILVVGLACMGIALMADGAQAATTLSPNQPDGGYRVGMAVRACSTNTMAATPLPKVTSPSGVVTNPPKDTDNCVAWTLTAAGRWTLEYETTGLQGTTQTMALQAADVSLEPPLWERDPQVATAVMAALWLGLVIATRFIRDPNARMLATLAGYGLLAMPAIAFAKAIFLLGHTGLVAYDAFSEEAETQRANKRSKKNKRWT